MKIKKRTENINIRVTPEEKEQLTIYANTINASITDIIECALLKLGIISEEAIF